MITFRNYVCVQYYEIFLSIIFCTIILIFPLNKQFHFKLKDVIEVSIPKGNVDSSGK